MKILLACAKIMNNEIDAKYPALTQPLFLQEANMIADELSKWTVEEMASKLNCSNSIASENIMRLKHRRFSEPAIPAILAYHGQAYKYLRADEFSQEELNYAQNHLFITSFLYGLLHPLDGIHPYRLEGKVKLDCTDDKDMFHFWRSRITEILINEVKADDGILVHLATKEMEHLFDWKRVKKEVRVIQPLFMMDTGSMLKAVSVHAKSCRGAMTRYILKNKIANPDELVDFSLEGYTYNHRYGDKDYPHFINIK